ncbi:hypothetical protein H4R24_005369 [Coemansia sp. RSA 988]|nr:hypothetical protein H4R24_005369 [Coemansia sp. RSA 988]
MKASLALLLLGAGALAVDELKATSFISSADTKFGATIEGTGVDKAGEIYAVSFNNDLPSAGQVTGKQQLLYKASDSKAYVNGIRFNTDSKGAEEAYIVDAALHQVYRLTERQTSDGKFAKADVFCKDEKMLQPNDLAIAPSSGRIFLSGMNYTSDSANGDGDLWTCDSAGAATRLGQFYRTNGIEVSPDEKTLYLSESQNKGGAVVVNRILALDLDASSGAVTNKRVFVDFGKLDKSADTDIDGMRTDSNGNLYVTRNGIGKVAVFTPSGELSAYISTPSIDFVASLEFGGPSGKDLYMVGKCKDDETKGCVDKYSADAAPVTEVWNALRKQDFKFWALVKSVQLSSSPSDVGGTRRTTFVDGTVQVHRLLEFSELNRSLTYEIIGSEPPIGSLSAQHTIKVFPVTADNTSYVQWSSDFSSEGSLEAVMDSKYKKLEALDDLAKSLEKK